MLNEGKKCIAFLCITLVMICEFFDSGSVAQFSEINSQDISANWTFLDCYGLIFIL